MRVQFLGAGNAFSRELGTTCSLLTLDSGEKWLIDCGRQAPDQLPRAGLCWHDIYGQIITHVHGDHVFGLEDFAFSRFFETRGDQAAVIQGGAKAKMIVHSAVRAELEQTLAPALRYVAGQDQANGSLTDYFEMCTPVGVEHSPAGVEHSPVGVEHRGTSAQMPWNHSETFCAGELELTLRETPHVPGKPAMAVEFSVGDGKLAWWSGDSRVDAAQLVRLAPRCMVMFHDCTFHQAAGAVHGWFDELALLPEQVRRKIVLMHHDDDIEEHRSEAEALGFRIALPGHVYDLISGKQAL